MKILLVRPKYENIFAGLNFINVEPLELEYLYTILMNEGHSCSIYDGQVETTSFEKSLKHFEPDFVAISGYVVAKNIIIRYSQIVKEYNSSIRVMVGGVHAELNYTDFYVPSIDYIIHSGGFTPALKIVKAGQDGMYVREIKGICYRNIEDEWVCNEREAFCPDSLPIPDRSHFYNNKKHFNYLTYGACAVVKASYGCPYQCNFCYCCLLNEGKYACRDLEKVVDEIEGIICDVIWIVDDTFTISRDRVTRFIQLIKERGIKKKFIIYGRADFITRNEDIIASLKEIGVDDIIVGLEAIEDSVLLDYDKKTTAQMNLRCVEILNKNSIECSGLFMVNPYATREDFKRLFAWIKKAKLRFLTVSVFAPFPGTPLYEKYRDQFITENYDDWDLLHLVIKPENMSEKQFYYELYKLYLKVVFINKRFGDFDIRYIKQVFRLIRNFAKRLISKDRG